MGIYKNVIILLLLLTVLACKKKDEENECTAAQEFDRQEMVSHLTTQYIIPAYDDYFEKTEALELDITTFLQDPTTEKLDIARSSWKQVATSWQNVAFLEFGPAENIGLRSQTNIYPVDTVKINNNILNGSANISLPANYDAKGIQTLEYLLFRPDKTDQEINSFYTNYPNAIDNLKSITQELRVHAKEMTVGWQNISEDFINNTANNAQGSAVSNIVNSLSAHYETFVRKGKVGLPVGVFNGFSQTPMPGHTEGLYSGYSFTLLIAQMEAIKNFINGRAISTSTEGLGLNNYMDFVEAKKGDINLSAAINDQIDQIISEIKNINSEPLSEAVINQSVSCKTLYQSMQKLVPLIKVDLTSALGVLISYQDNDGD